MRGLVDLCGLQPDENQFVYVCLRDSQEIGFDVFRCFKYCMNFM